MEEISLKEIACADAKAKALSKRDWLGYLLLHDRSERLRALFRIIPSLDDAEYWRFVGDCWTDTEYPYKLRSEWRLLFGWKRGDPHDMMSDAADRAAFDDLPQTLTLYRGINRLGSRRPLPQKLRSKFAWSWTLIYETAEFFARRFAGDESSDARVAYGELGEWGAVYTVQCDKSLVLAYFHGGHRNEAEVLIGDPSRLPAALRVAVCPHCQRIVEDCKIIPCAGEERNR
jgi:hypothetical protein